MTLVLGLQLTAALGTAQSISPAVAKLAREGLDARQSGRYEDAANAFEAVLEASPDFLAAHLNLGLTRHEQGEYAKAAIAFESALQLDPKLTDVRQLLGYDLVAAGRFREAIGVLKLATPEVLATPDIQYSLGLAHLRTGEFAAAIVWFERALQQSPASPELLRLSAEAHSGLARSQLEQLLISAPESVAAKIVMAQQATASRQYGEAIDLYEAALQTSPGRADIRVPLGDLYLNGEDFARAEELYRTEFQVRPGFALAAERWGESLLLLGRSAEAKVPLERAMELDPQSLTAQSLMAKALVDVGDLARAVTILRDVLGSAPSPEVAARTHYQLGSIYRKLQRPAESREQMRLFQQLQLQLREEDQ